jgi:hypothetical protein
MLAVDASAAGGKQSEFCHYSANFFSRHLSILRVPPTGFLNYGMLRD